MNSNVVVSRLSHYCPDQMFERGTIKHKQEVWWERGKWFCGIKRVSTCPYCKQKLPDVTKFNALEVLEFTWSLEKMEAEPLIFKGLGLYQKERKKRTVLADPLNLRGQR